MTSKMALVGQTRTHSPHQVQPGVVGIAVAPDDDLGVRPALPDVEHAHLLDLLAGAHAAGAEDAEGHVVLDHHVAGTVIALAGAERAGAGGRDLVVHDVALEFVAGMFAATVGEVLAGIPIEQELAARRGDSTPPRRSRMSPPCRPSPGSRTRAPASGRRPRRPGRSGNWRRWRASDTSRAWESPRRSRAPHRGSWLRRRRRVHAR